MTAAVAERPPEQVAVPPDPTGTRTAAEIALYAAASLVLLWPVTLHLATRVAGSASSDAQYYLWLGWRWSGLLADGSLLTTRIPDAVYPFGFDLRYVDGQLPTFALALVNLVTGPVLAYNLTLAGGSFANFLAGRHLGRICSTDRRVWVLTAFAFATAPVVTLRIQVGHLPLLWAFTLPLLVAEALRTVHDPGRGVRPVRLAVLLVLAFACSVYYLVFGGIAYPLVVGVHAVRTGAAGLAARRVLAGVGLAALALSPLLAARLAFDAAERDAGAPADLGDEAEVLEPDVLAAVVRPREATLPLPPLDGFDDRRVVIPGEAIEGTAHPGLLLLLAAAALLVLRGRTRAPLAAAALALWLLALGPSLRWRGDHALRGWLPFRWLLEVPGLGSLRVSERAAYVLAAVLAAAAALTLDRFLRAARGRQHAGTAVVAGAAVLLAWNLVLPVPHARFDPPAATRAAFAAARDRAGEGEAIMRVPTDCDFEQIEFVKTQVFHGLPVVGCAGSWAALAWYTDLAEYLEAPAFARLRCDRGVYGRLETDPRPEGPAAPLGRAATEELRARFGVRFLAVDRRALARPACRDVAAALPALGGRLLGGDPAGLEVVDLAVDAGPGRP